MLSHLLRPQPHPPLPRQVPESFCRMVGDTFCCAKCGCLAPRLTQHGDWPCSELYSCEHNQRPFTQLLRPGGGAHPGQWAGRHSHADRCRQLHGGQNALLGLQELRHLTQSQHVSDAGALYLLLKSESDCHSYQAERGGLQSRLTHLRPKALFGPNQMSAAALSNGSTL